MSISDAIVGDQVTNEEEELNSISSPAGIANQHNMPDVALWIRSEVAQTGREVKIYLPKDSHVADIAARAAESLSFGGEKKMIGDIIVKNCKGDELKKMTPIIDLDLTDVILIGTLATDEDNMWSSRSKSWSGQHVDTTEWGVDTNELVDEDLIATAKDGEGNDESIPSRSCLRDSDPLADPGLPRRAVTWTPGAFDEDESEEEPDRDVIQSSTPESNKPAATPTSESLPEKDKDKSKMYAKPGMQIDTSGDGKVDSFMLDSTGDGLVDTIAPLVVPAFATPVTAGAQLLVDTTGDGQADSILRDTTGDGCGDTLCKLDDTTARVQDLILPTFPKEQAHPCNISRAPVPAVYVDRIPPDASDAMIRNAIKNELPPLGIEKVQSLEVIRNQKTRHCHAFAFLTHPPPTEPTMVKLDETNEHIRIQASDKERAVPQEVTPRATLHIRLYARREGWVSGVSKMMWAGLLAVLEDVCPRITDCVGQIADDKSKKNLQVHKTVVLCAFFVECPTIAKATFLRKQVHDKRTSNGDGKFLVQCDYTLSDKKLHDTSKKKDNIARAYRDALRLAREFTKDDNGVSSWPTGVSQFFEFDSKNDLSASPNNGANFRHQSHQQSHQSHQHFDNRGGKKTTQAHQVHQGRQMAVDNMLPFQQLYPGMGGVGNVNQLFQANPSLLTVQQQLEQQQIQQQLLQFMALQSESAGLNQT